MTMLPKADRFAEDRSNDPYWNESSWFSFSIPERHIHGAIQYYFRPNMNLLNGGPMMWDSSDRFQWDCLYYNWSHLQAIPPGAEKYDMTARNSLSVKVLEPLTRYKITYDKEGFEANLTWDAIAPLHELKTESAQQNATNRFHFEQAGRMHGIIRRHDEEYSIDCFSMRDGSSGPRNYESMSRVGYFWGIAENSAFHALCRGNGPRTKCAGGFLWKDGKMASLVSGEREVLEYGPHGPSRVQFRATDSLGRSMSTIGEVDPGLIFAGYTDHTVVWSLTKWDWDGAAHWGDNQESYPSEFFRRLARGEIKLGS